MNMMKIDDVHIFDVVLRELNDRIEKRLNDTGIFYRYWSRIKSNESIKKKFKQKKTKIIIKCKI